jgi:hypothetical protein
MPDLAKDDSGSKRFTNNLLLNLTVVIYLTLYFLGFLIGDLYLLYVTGIASLIWSIVIGILSLNRMISNHFATTLKCMLAGWGVLIFAFIVLLMYAWIAGGYQANLNELTRSFRFAFVLQIGPLWLCTLGGFIIGYLLSLLIGMFFRLTNR